jgi:dienelactone hydrolase
MKLTRRQLGIGALAAQAASSQEPPTTYTGPLDNFAAEAPAAWFDPVTWVRQRWAEAPRMMRFQATNKRQAQAWQKRLRLKVASLVGPLPEIKTKPQVKLLEKREFAGYTREKFIFESRPGVGVLAYLLLPKGVSGKVPVIVCAPGHGRGVDDLVGIDEKGRDRTKRVGYQYDFAIQVAEQGVAALAIELMGFGCRRDPINYKKSLGQKACEPASGAALLLGETMIGWRIYDISRSIDWIETRPDLDATRVACMGISGGGMATQFAAALDDRIKAAFISGYLNSFRDSVMSLAHCVDNYVPGILNWCESADIAGLIAPRPLFVESGDRDPIFPIEASRQAFADVKKIYEVFGAAGAVEHHVFPAAHEFNGARGIPFLVKSLKG